MDLKGGYIRRRILKGDTNQDEGIEHLARHRHPPQRPQPPPKKLQVSAHVPAKANQTRAPTPTSAVKPKNVVPGDRYNACKARSDRRIVTNNACQRQNGYPKWRLQPL